MHTNFKESLGSPNFFTKFQEMSLIANTLHMFEELEDIIVNERDEFIVEYDYSVQKHIVLHKSFKYKETRPICYVDTGDFNMKLTHMFIINCLREAWVEYLV